MRNWNLKQTLRRDINKVTGGRLSYDERRSAVDNLYVQLSGLSDSEQFVDDALGYGEEED